MNRCRRAPLSFFRPAALRQLVLATLSTATLLLTAPAAVAQVAPGLGLQRNFPDSALRGTLGIESTVQATLNGKSIRMAPGMRLFNPQNALVMTHSVIGQRFKVNYMIEASTGMLITAWILTEREAERPRKGSDSTVTNIRSEYDNSAPTSP